MSTDKPGKALARIKGLIHHEAAGGVLLMAAGVLALILANSRLVWLYEALLGTPMSVRIGVLEIAKPLLLWINDGLMALFFFVVGLEIKRELREGRLSSWRQASFPLASAIGGMIVPAAIYAALNRADPIAMQGWAIPMATDIAFALGVLALLGRRVPRELKVFLLTLAIVDDLGAILIIALFYTSDLSIVSLSIAGVAFACLVLLNRAGIKSITPYALLGIVVWVAVLKSGVHATLAGVITATMIPLNGRTSNAPSPAKKLEHDLNPWVSLGVMPLFAFANAGVSLKGLSPDIYLHTIPLGIVLGLFLGKPIGIFGFAYLAARLGLAAKPYALQWSHVQGVAALGGIGFTMSLFIGTLAFSAPDTSALVRLGVFAGSIASGICGYVILRWVGRSMTESRELAPAFTSAETQFPLLPGPEETRLISKR